MTARTTVENESDAREQSRPRRGMPRARTIVGVLFFASFFLLVATSLLRYSTAEHPMSFIDEHTHLDNQFKVHNGTYPYRGALYGDEVVTEWACGVGHQAGPPALACQDPALGADDLVSGKYTTGYIHYPTFFLGGEAYRFVADVVSDARPLNVYRSYSAVMFILGIAVCGLLSWRLGLRGAALFAGTFVPVASSQMMLFGTIHNPMSTAVLAGAVIAFTSIRWVTTGRGFGWVVASIGGAAVVAVTDSLPGGAVMLMVLAALALPLFGRHVAGPWKPRWWHLAVIALTLVVPIVVFGQFISRRATAADSEIYGGYGFESWTPIIVGAIREMFVFHNPWAEVMLLEVTDNNPVKLAVRAMGYGLPETISFLVIGAAALFAVRALRERRDAGSVPTRVEADSPVAADSPVEVDASSGDSRAVGVLPLLAGATLLGMTLYPPALRLVNAIQAGVDFGIVARYSMSFAPLVVWLALLGTRHAPWFARLLAGAAALGLGALCVQAW